MVTDQQVKRLFRLMNEEKTFRMAALKAGMDEKTARKYRDLGKLPSELEQPRSWRTRTDPFEEVWPEVRTKLEVNPGLQGTTLFRHLQQQYPGRFQDGQLRTLQRRIKRWRATDGPPKEVFFPQRHRPGERAQSDFTCMNDLRVTIQGAPFEHLIYHFVLTYSNWEAGRVCFSESFEALSAGLQEALFELGGAPAEHQTDRLSAAVHNDLTTRDFRSRYKALLTHYGMVPVATQAESPHENGDVEQRHYRFKVALDQQLMLRGSRDFASRASYEAFLEKLFGQLNAGRRERLEEEAAVLKPLPKKRLPVCRRLKVRVRKSSTIRVARNTYSVDSRLIGEQVEVRLYGDRLDIWYGQKRVDRIPRLSGRGKHHINYRHVIDGLVRKPGAFKNYRYRADLFPTVRFRRCWDLLQEARPATAAKQYLKILHLAARESEELTDRALRQLLVRGECPTSGKVAELVRGEQTLPPLWQVQVDDVKLNAYDALLADREVAHE